MDLGIGGDMGAAVVTATLGSPSAGRTVRMDAIDGAAAEESFLCPRITVVLYSANADPAGSSMSMSGFSLWSPAIRVPFPSLKMSAGEIHELVVTEPKAALEGAPFASLTLTLCRPLIAASSSSSLSPPPSKADSSSILTSSTGWLTRMPLPTPMPKLGIRGAALGRLAADRNLTLPTCWSAPSASRPATSISIARRRERIVTIVGRLAGEVLQHSSARSTRSGGQPGEASFRTSSASMPK